MRLPTRSFLTTTLLAGAVALVFAASLSGASELFGGAVLCLVAAAALTLMRLDRRVPSEDETRHFVASVVQARGYAGAFRIGDFSQVTSHGIEPGNVRVKFRGELAIHEALYQPAVPTADAFKGLTARKVDWLRRTAAMLERELGPLAAGLAARAPADPFRATFVAVRKPGGWTLPFTGAAWAMRRGDSWSWDLSRLSQDVDSLVVHGKPLAAYPAAIELASPEGKVWLKSSLAAWREYEAEVAALQHKIDEVRAARAREAMGGFFHDVQAGTTYQGTGESLTQQSGVARFFLEFTSAHAANHTVAFTLRSDRRWQAARPFSGTVAFNAASGRVAIQARTAATDAQRDAGPMLSVPAPFDLELTWTAGTPPRLEGSAVDLVLRLAQVLPDELTRLLEQVHAREREIAAAIAPGGVYRGSVAVEGEEQPLKVEFLPAVDTAAGAARVESGAWSAVFRVRTSGEAVEAGFDLALESTVPAAAPRAAADAATPSGDPETWGPILLRLASDRFSGMVVSGELRLPIGELAPTPPPPPA